MEERKTQAVATAKLSSKYQTVIPSPIRKEMGLKRGDWLLWKVKKENGRTRATVELKPENWSEYLSGLGKEVWKGVDSDKYIKKLRKEWEKQ